MKKFLVALSAVALLTGVAPAQSNDNNFKASAESDVRKPVKKHRPSATTGSSGYTIHPPKHDAGRYSNLPGKDGLNSKAFLQDH
jgi:hypothetical protein